MSLSEDLTNLIIKGDYVTANNAVFDLSYIEEGLTKYMWHPTNIGQEIKVDGVLRMEDNAVLFLEL